MNFYVGPVTEVRMTLINQNVGSPMHMSLDSVWNPSSGNVNKSAFKSANVKEVQWRCFKMKKYT